MTTLLAPPEARPFATRLPRPSLRQIRLASGLVLFAFVLPHFTNLILGNVSVATMEAGRAVELAVWRNPFGDALLTLAVLTHGSLGLYALYARRHFRLGLTEGVQLLFGLAIPVLLIPHVIDTRLAGALFGSKATYPLEIYKFWISDPGAGLRQTTLAVVV